MEEEDDRAGAGRAGQGGQAKRPGKF